MDQPRGLLHRLSGALLGRARGTDWWMVAVEIAIVVFGILIAFQLDRWGDRRQQRRDEAQLMDQMAEEARIGSKALDFFAAQHRQSAAHVRELATALRDPAVAARYPRQGDGCDLLRLPAVQRQSAGAIAQGAGPRIELIRDLKLRELLRAAESQRQFNDSQLGFFRANFLNYGERLEPHMRWTFTREGADVNCAVDIAGLAADPAAVALLPKVARDQWRFAGYRDEERRYLDGIVTRVACLRAGTCRPAT